LHVYSGRGRDTKGDHATARRLSLFFQAPRIVLANRNFGQAATLSDKILNSLRIPNADAKRVAIT
jgi:hypothetical protein